MMLKNKFQNKLVVITGPSAVGKDAVATELVKWLPLKKVITTTSRPMRPGEKRGINYHFVSRKIFEEMIKKNLLVEFTEFNKNYYGTQRKDIKKPILDGFAPLLLVDPHYALKLQQNNPEALVIFIKPDSINIIKKRLVARGGSLDEINNRLKSTKEAMAKEHIFTYSLINREGKLTETVRLAKQIIRRYLGF